ncbi:rcc01693 family protein [Thioclava sp. FR2]|uniref:rcc01693 family protein n=1 Tax=Thioclava sp. FR2 TaxID=3445780 RepID=UPI003EB7DF32
MNGFDWPALLRVALFELQLRPEEFWKLTPLELRIMRGAEADGPPLTRARLEELSAAFPDKTRDRAK